MYKRDTTGLISMEGANLRELHRQGLGRHEHARPGMPDQSQRLNRTSSDMPLCDRYRTLLVEKYICRNVQFAESLFEIFCSFWNRWYSKTRKTKTSNTRHTRIAKNAPVNFRLLWVDSECTQKMLDNRISGSCLNRCLEVSITVRSMKSFNFCCAVLAARVACWSSSMASHHRVTPIKSYQIKNKLFFGSICARYTQINIKGQWFVYSSSMNS